MADDFSRIIQLAGLSHLNEDTAFKTEPQQGSDFKRKTVGAMKSRHNTQSDWAPPEEEDESDRMVQEEGEDEFDMGDMSESDDVTITLPRNCAEWLKNHLSGEMSDEEEATMVVDAVDEALCDDGECETTDDMDGGEEAAGDELEDDMGMM